MYIRVLRWPCKHHALGLAIMKSTEVGVRQVAYSVTQSSEDICTSSNHQTWFELQAGALAYTKSLRPLFYFFIHMPCLFV